MTPGPLPEPGVTSPDGRQLQRMSCPDCGYGVAVAIWCQDPGCCEQDPARFIRSLRAAEIARGIPVFAVRYLNPSAAAGPADRVDVWRAGNPEPVFAGPVVAAIVFQLRHDCPPAGPDHQGRGRRGEPPGRSPARQDPG
jgi:hypothetical protein